MSRPATTTHPQVHKLVPKEMVEALVKSKEKLAKILDKNYEHVKDQINGKNRKRWRVVAESNGVQVLGLANKVNSHCEYMTVIEHDKSPREVFSFFRDFKNRAKWDTNVSVHCRIASLGVDEKTDLGNDLTYTCTQPIAAGLITARSYFNVRGSRKCEDTGCFMEAALSVETLEGDLAKYPERVDDSTGAILFFGSGGLWEPLDGGKRTRVTYITLTDPQGWLPHVAVNQVMPGELTNYHILIKGIIASKRYVFALVGKPAKTNGKVEEKEAKESKKFTCFNSGMANLSITKK